MESYMSRRCLLRSVLSSSLGVLLIAGFLLILLLARPKHLYHGIAAAKADVLTKKGLANFSHLPLLMQQQLEGGGEVTLTRTKRVSLTMRHVLRAVDSEPIATPAAEEERQRTKDAFIRSIDS